MYSKLKIGGEISLTKVKSRK